MIEMIFVLMIAMIFFSISTHTRPNSMHLQAQRITELLHLAQLRSIMNAENVRIEFDGKILYIDEQSYDLSPLVCEHEQFHYNELGHISQADTISCFQNEKEIQFVFQLGSGWQRVQ